MKVQTACFRCGEIDMNLTAFWQGKCQVGERAGNVDVGDCARQHGVLGVGFPFVRANVADSVLLLPAVLSIQRPGKFAITPFAFFDAAFKGIGVA